MGEKFTYTPKLDPARSRKYERQKVGICCDLYANWQDMRWVQFVYISYVAAASLRFTESL